MQIPVGGRSGAKFIRRKYSETALIFSYTFCIESTAVSTRCTHLVRCAVDTSCIKSGSSNRRKSASVLKDRSFILEAFVRGLDNERIFAEFLNVKIKRYNKKTLLKFFIQVFGVYMFTS